MAHGGERAQYGSVRPSIGVKVKGLHAGKWVHEGKGPTKVNFVVAWWQSKNFRELIPCSPAFIMMAPLLNVCTLVLFQMQLAILCI